MGNYVVKVTDKRFKDEPVGPQSRRPYPGQPARTDTGVTFVLIVARM